MGEKAFETEAHSFLLFRTPASSEKSVSERASLAEETIDPKTHGSAYRVQEPGRLGILCVASDILRPESLRALAAHGWRLHAARCGSEALDLLAQESEWIVLVCDSRMLRDEDPLFLEAARKAAPNTPRILLWDPSDPSCLTAAVNRAEVFRILPAPIAEEELARTVQEALERRRTLEQNTLRQNLLEMENAALKRERAALEEKAEAASAELENARRQVVEERRKLKNTYMHMIRMFSNVLALHDPKSKTHGANVAELAARVGRALHLDPSALEALVVASIFHDVGKMGLPESVREKPREKLDPIEEALYRTHPVRGQMVFDSMEYMRDVGVVIRHHHESYTGGGFPDGLSGGQIPLASRILSLADAVDRWMEQETGDDPVASVVETLRANEEGRFDESLEPYFEESIAAVYDKIVPAEGVSEREISLSQLRPGMILTRDIVSGTGITVAKKGRVLKGEVLQKIRRCYEIDPPSRPGIAVWEGE